MWTNFAVWMRTLMSSVANEEDGQALVEYALILSLIAVVAIGALTLLGTNVTGILNTIAGKL